MYKNSVRKIVLPLLLSAALLFGSAPLSASAHTSKTEAIKTVKIDISNVNSDGGDGYTYDGDTVTIKDSGFSYEITGSTSSNKIAVSADSEASPVNITLDGAKIDVSSSDDSCAFKLNNKSVVNLTLKGANTLKSGKDCAGLQAPDGTELTVTRGSTGSLGATGGSDGAGIGGGNSITISGGTVSATGGSDSAGIGAGGNCDDNGSCTITGGSVNAVNGDGTAPGIPSGVTDGSGNTEYLTKVTVGKDAVMSKSMAYTAKAWLTRLTAETK